MKRDGDETPKEFPRCGLDSIERRSRGNVHARFSRKPRHVVRAMVDGLHCVARKQEDAAVKKEEERTRGQRKKGGKIHEKGRSGSYPPLPHIGVLSVVCHMAPLFQPPLYGFLPTRQR